MTTALGVVNLCLVDFHALLLLFLLLFLLFSSRFLSSLYDTQGEKEDDTGVAGGYDEVLEEIESSGGGVAGGGEEKGESPVAE